MEVKIRKVEIGDINNLWKMYSKLFSFHEKMDTYYKLDEEFDSWKNHVMAAIESEQYFMLVAEINGKQIAFIEGHIKIEPFLKEKIHGVIDTAFVENEYRKKDVMKKLCHNLINWFKNQNVSIVELLVDLRNPDAILSWERLGFERYNIKMKKSI